MTTLETRRALFTAQENSKGKSVDFAYFERKGRTGALVSRERRRCHGFTHLKKNPLTEATESEKSWRNFWTEWPFWRFFSIGVD